MHSTRRLSARTAVSIRPLWTWALPLSRRLKLAEVIVAVAVIAVVGCGTATGTGIKPSSGNVPSIAGTTAIQRDPSSSAVGSNVTSPAEWGAPDGSVARAFATAEAGADGLRVYAPTLLPNSTVAPDTWWPISEVDSPSAYAGPRVSNPHILSEEGGLPEIRVALKSSDGWLEIIEDVRGDLGDIEGTSIGTISGRQATLYVVEGCYCVQWSDEGIWYAVFARGWSEEDIREVALDMRPLGES